MSISPPPLCIYGAGSVGCYLGGRLLAAGVPVRFVGRPRIREELVAHGLRVSDYRGAERWVPPGSIVFDETAAGAEVVLVTVKTAATSEVGRALAQTLTPGAAVIAFQNGLHNAERLCEALPEQTVLAGMVPFNVLHRGEGHFHQGSGGRLMLERHVVGERLAEWFARAGLPPQLRDDMAAVLHAKLLLNLNNPINALSGLTLREELSRRDYRRCLAAAQREALAGFAVAGIRPARLTPVPTRWFPRLLELPDGLFRRVAGTALAIDPLARSSMWEDLEAGRVTEIDWINGEVVELAAGQGRSAPVNAALVRLIRAAERGDRRDWGGEELWAETRR